MRQERMMISTGVNEEKESMEKRPKQWYRSLEGRREFVEDVAKAYGIEKREDWRRVTSRHIHAMGGGSLLSEFSGSWYRVLIDVYGEEGVGEEHECRGQVSRGYWKDQGRRKRFMKAVADGLGIERMRDWKSIPRRRIVTAGGGGLLAQYGNSVAALIDSVAESTNSDTLCEAEHKRSAANGQTVAGDCHRSWDSLTECQGEERKGMTSAGDMSEGGNGHLHGTPLFLEESQWKRSDCERSRALLLTVAKRLQVMEGSEWERVSASEAVALGCGPLIAAHGGCWRSVLQNVLSITVAARERLPQGFWDEEEHQREVVECYLRDHCLRTDGSVAWTVVDYGSLSRSGGRGALEAHGGSLHSLFFALFPLHKEELKRSLCHVSRPGIPPVTTSAPGEDRTVTFLERCRESLGLKSLKDWERVSIEQVRSVPGGGAFLKEHRLFDALSSAYPQEKWSEEVFTTKGKKASQRHLRWRIEQLFPTAALEEDVRSESMRSLQRGSALELDIFLPQHRVAFEYQGQHHYQETPVFGPLDVIQSRDERKKRLAEEQGIRLIEIPHWWDGQKESLAATIHRAFPELLESHCNDTDLLSRLRRGVIRPIGSFEEWKASRVTTKASKRSTTSVLPSQQAWQRGKDVRGFFVTPTKEGVRCWWSEGKLADSFGRVIDSPEEWRREMPSSEAVEGVLTCEGISLGRVLRQRLSDGNWENVTFVALDLILDTPTEFTDRIERLQNLRQSSLFSAADYIECRDDAHLTTLLEESSEGLQLRSPGKSREVFYLRRLYETNVTMVGKSDRSRTFVIEVTAHDGSKARQTARCSLQQWQHPPSPGTSIVVAHAGTWTSGKLKYPSCL